MYFISFISTADWLRQCSKDNPNEDDCFKQMFEGMFPMLAKGKNETISPAKKTWN